MISDSDDAIDAINQNTLKMTGSHTDYDALIAANGDTEIVLLGETTHGTMNSIQAWPA